MKEVNLKGCARKDKYCPFRREAKTVKLALCEGGIEIWKTCDHMARPGDKVRWSKIWKWNLKSFFPSLIKWRMNVKS